MKAIRQRLLTVRFFSRQSKVGRERGRLLICLSLLALLAGCQGCRDSAQTSVPGGPASATGTEQYREELLTYALDNLNRLEEFDAADVIRQIPERLEALKDSKPDQADSRVDPLLAAWPEPEMLRQIVDRLNGWIRTQQPPENWRLDPLVAALPKPLAELPQVKNLDQMEYSSFDGFALREAVWLRDVARWAGGDSQDAWQRARSLFDWTVRNIQLDANNENRGPQFPWETLLFGRGTATERAWVFILLARQLHIDAAMLAVGEPSRPAEATDGASAAPPPSQGELGAGKPRVWCIAVLIEGNAYLFEPQLGLPIPAPDGVTLEGTGQLAIRPATLAQAAANEEVLRQLDVDTAHAYGVKSSELKRLVVMLEASPTYLSRRMMLLESRLVGGREMVLTTSPAAQAEHWKALPQVAAVRLWLPPFETLEERSHLDRQRLQSRLFGLLPFYAMPTAPLYRGRILQLKGRLLGDEGAILYYQKARPPNEELAISSAHPMEKLFFQQGKQDASYWLGLINYQRGKYDAAIDDFFTRTLRAAPNSPWTSGALYNMARACEAGGDLNGAILQYQNNVSSPGYHGDLLRAKWLMNLGEKKQREKAAGG